MIGILGVVISLALLILLALRGVNIFIASIVASIVAAVTNLRPLNEALMTDFSQSMMGFAGNFFLLFITGAVFGRMMGESRAAASIARYLGERMGMDRALLIIIISTALLTYGGVNAFIVIFTLYPLGLWLVYRANLPKRLLLGAAALGAGTFTMTAMPGAPSIHNNISADALGTSLLAGPWIGLSASAIMFLLGWIYLEREKKKALGRGECFEPGPSDHLSSGEGDAESLPDWRKSSVPMIAVLGWILIPGAWARLQPPAPSENGLLVLSFLATGADSVDVSGPDDRNAARADLVPARAGISAADARARRRIGHPSTVQHGSGYRFRRCGSHDCHLRVVFRVHAGYEVASSDLGRAFHQHRERARRLGLGRAGILDAHLRGALHRGRRFGRNIASNRDDRERWSGFTSALRCRHHIPDRHGADAPSRIQRHGDGHPRRPPCRNRDRDTRGDASRKLNT